jgi:acyl-CoA hydrolase
MEKHISDSKTEQIQIIMEKDINGAKRLFGGKLVEWIDVVAAVVARRHSNREVTTVAMDNLQFTAPAHLNNTIILLGKITYAGNTSMEVRVDTFVENLNGERLPINVAYVVLVAIDENEKPVSVPRIILDSAEEKEEWERGRRRSELRKTRRAEKY